MLHRYFATTQKKFEVNLSLSAPTKAARFSSCGGKSLSAFLGGGRALCLF
jgi:hypothetical protein